MEQIKRKTNTKSGVGQWLTALFCVAFCFVQTSTIEFDRLLAHILWIIWFASLFVFDAQKIVPILAQKKYLYLYLFAAFYLISSSFAVGVGTSINRVIELFEFASPIMMFDYYYRGSNRLKYFLLISLLLIILYNVVELIIAMNTYGLGLRLVHQEEDYYLKNSYNWAYSWVLITTFAVYFLFGKNFSFGKHKILGIIIAVIAVLGCYIVINSFFMTAIIGLLLGLILSFTYGKRRWIFKTVIISIIGIVMFSSLYFVIEKIGNKSENATVVFQRIEEIYNITEGNAAAASDFNSRSDLTNMSINTFISNPLFGINHEVTSFDKVQYRKVGDHSQWIDNLALYGVFSLLLLLFLIKSAKLSLSDCYHVFIVYIFFGFANPIWYFPINFCLFFFIPLSFFMLREKSKDSISTKISQ